MVASILIAATLAAPSPTLTAPLEHTYAQAWKIASAALPGRARPPLDLEELAPMSVEADVYAGAIHPSMRLLGPMTLQMQADTCATLIHEIAHAFQRPGMPTWKVEGGAEAFSRHFDKKIAAVYGTYPNYGPAYEGYVARVRRSLSDAWILRGQFTTP